MAFQTYNVYLKAAGFAGTSLVIECTGTKEQCENFLKRKKQKGESTNLNFISSYPMERARKSYL